MLQLHDDGNFHYEALRALSLTRYYGSDIGEILEILPKIKAGDFDSWYTEWQGLAKRVLLAIDESNLKAYSPITLRDVYLRASHYFFVAGFFLHGNLADPRSFEGLASSRVYFDKGNAQLPIPGQYVCIATEHGFEVPAYIYRTAAASSVDPKPTLIIGGGFDSNMEETMSVMGFPALERGFNVIIYEGPGMPALLREQKKGWIYDWEKAVSPIIDYVEVAGDALGFMDLKKLGLVGYSLGGYLAGRAAAFEPRLSAVILIDGVYSFEEAFYKGFPDCKSAWQQQDFETFSANFESTNEHSNTNTRWFHDQLKFSTLIPDAVGNMELVAKMTLADVASKIKMPAFIGDASDDIFFLGQPAEVAKAIGSNATLFDFGRDQAAGAHCQCGAQVYLNQAMYDWFASVVR